MANPFVIAVLVALVVLVALALISTRSTTSGESPPTAGRVVPAMPTLVLALVVVLVPFGIAIAALWGPTAGVVGYLVLFAAGLLGIVLLTRSSGPS